MKYFITSILMTVLCGCAPMHFYARMERYPADNSTNQDAPVTEQDTPGIINYLITSNVDHNDLRRQDAYKQMHDACGSKYKITKEYTGHVGSYGQTQQRGTFSILGDGFSSSSQFEEDEVRRDYIEFKCLP